MDCTLFPNSIRVIRPMMQCWSSSQNRFNCQMIRLVQNLHLFVKLMQSKGGFFLACRKKYNSKIILKSSTI